MTPPASRAFPRRARITRGAELQRVVREGARIRTTHVEVRVATPPPPLAGSAGAPVLRVGLIVPRHRQSAVARNRVKRRLRELVRRELLPAGVAADVVLRVRPGAYAVTFDGLRRDVLRARRGVAEWYAEQLRRQSSPPDAAAEEG